MINIALVPVAGWGTRLLPATKSQPKEMLPVGRKPVVQYVVEELVQSGIRRMLFVTGQGKTSIENHFDIDAPLITYLRETGREEQLQELQFERADVEYFYTRQRQQLGLGHAVLCGQAMIGNQPFVVALGDSFHDRTAGGTGLGECSCGAGCPAGLGIVAVGYRGDGLPVACRICPDADAVRARG